LRDILLPDFRWHAIGGAAPPHPNQLLLEGVEVARLYQRVDDYTWRIGLNNQRDRELRKQQLCSGYAQGKAGADLWTARHQDRLRAEVDQRSKDLKSNRRLLMR